MLVLAASEVTLMGASIDTADGKEWPLGGVFTGPASANHEVRTMPVRAAAADPYRLTRYPRSCDGGRPIRAGRDQRRAVAGEAGDTVDPRGLTGLGEGQRRRQGGEPPGQH